MREFFEIWSIGAAIPIALLLPVVIALEGEASLVALWVQVFLFFTQMLALLFALLLGRLG